MNILDAAADVLRGHWMQGDFTDGQGNYCAMGALDVVAPVYVQPGEYTYTIALMVLETLCGREHGVGVADFNDDSSTSEEDVLLLFKKASAVFDQEHLFVHPICHRVMP